MMEKNNIDRRIRQNLIRLRLDAGLTQNVLAQRSKVRHVAQIEAGRQSAGKEVLIRLAHALGVDVVELFRERSEKNDKLKVLHDLYSGCSPRSKQLIEEIVVAISKADKDWGKDL